MKLTVHTATRLDVDRIAMDLRAADALELRLAGFPDPEQAVRDSFDASRWCKVARADGEPVVLFGIGPGVEPHQGVPWMLATDGIGAIGREFVLQSVHELRSMLCDYQLLHNCVHAGNEISIRWLRWLGFNVDEKPIGPGGNFHYFWKRRTDV
jgi:hypothetical protein